MGDIQSFVPNLKYDIVILHGPLYHITRKSERIKVLNKCRAMLKCSGLILGFGINRYAGYFFGVRSGKIWEPSYRQTVLDEIGTGIRTKNPGWYFHTPDEMADEFSKAGLAVIDIKSVISQAWMLPGIKNDMSNPDKLKIILELAGAVEDKTEIGQDLLCVGKLPE